jgi:adenylate cyclase
VQGRIYPAGRWFDSGRRETMTHDDRTNGRPGRELLRRLLSDRNQYPDRAAAIDEEIRGTFERRVAILVLDMSGFSRLTRTYGIIHYLAMIRQMETAATPAVMNNGGTVIRQEADDLFAIFDEPAQALEAALDIFLAFKAVNEVVPEERDICGSIGIGYGETLVIDDDDLFGNEMNVASKLGEDLAESWEILLTRAAHAALPAGRYRFSELGYTISGLELQAFRFESRMPPAGQEQG